MAKVLSKEEWKRRRKMIRYTKLIVSCAAVVLGLIILLWGGIRVVRSLTSRGEKTVTASTSMKQQLGLTEYFLSKNAYTRPGKSMDNVKGIVLHYAAGAGKSATQIRNEYEAGKDGNSQPYSTHFIVDLDGSIVQCIPIDEMACASGERNIDTIAISFCHPKTDGIPTSETYQSMVDLVVYLCRQCGLSQSDVLRHSDLDGENCPKYYAEQEEKWVAFLAEVDNLVKR